MKITDTALFSQICLGHCPWSWCEEKGREIVLQLFLLEVIQLFLSDYSTIQREHSRKLWAQSQRQYICQPRQLVLPLVPHVLLQYSSGSCCISLKAGLTSARRLSRKEQCKIKGGVCNTGERMFILNTQTNTLLLSFMTFTIPVAPTAFLFIEPSLCLFPIYRVRALWTLDFLSAHTQYGLLVDRKELNYGPK